MYDCPLTTPLSKPRTVRATALAVSHCSLRLCYGHICNVGVCAAFGDVETVAPCAGSCGLADVLLHVRPVSMLPICVL